MDTNMDGAHPQPRARRTPSLRRTALGLAVIASMAVVLLTTRSAPPGSWSASQAADAGVRPALEILGSQAAPEANVGQRFQLGLDWEGCQAQIRDLLEATATSASLKGWHGRHDPAVILPSQRPLRQYRSRGSQPTHVPSALFAIPTANVWPKTELLLHSLAVAHDSFEVLVVDELSADGTSQQLAAAGVKFIQPLNASGVTFNWNMAYQVWLETEHDALIISNNDVLVPDGVIDDLLHALTAEGGDCEVICPLSTVVGKGTWGHEEGIEALYKLSPIGTGFVNNPLNYQRVQDILVQSNCSDGAFVHESVKLHNTPGFSGFFFAMRRSAIRHAFDAQHLFNPGNRNLNQEMDLAHRLRADSTAKLCLHTGAFVFHYKVRDV